MQGERVRIESLKAHPRNPRRGDLEAIMESLQVNGQYQPIVINKDGTILAGNHTCRAAAELGWDEVDVVRLDVDDDEALRIVLADNRTSDLSTYDDAMLLNLLRDLPDLDGTAFTFDDIDVLKGIVETAFDSSSRAILRPNQDEGEDPFADDEADDEAGDDEATVEIKPFLEIPRLPKIQLTDEMAERIAARVRGASEEDRFRSLLGLPPRSRALSGVGRIGVGQRTSAVTQLEQVPVSHLHPHPKNARQGDVGAIASSLGEFGQYRPIVVNKRDQSILVGSHRWQAAVMLGWESIAVVYVDVDEDHAVRIMLADNRTADRSGYDDLELLAALQEVGSLDGTGWELDDLDDLWARVEAGKTTKNAEIIFVAPALPFRITTREPWRRYDAWHRRLLKQAGDDAQAAVEIVLTRLTA